MRSLFVIIIGFAFVCLFVLIQRRKNTNRATSSNRRRVQSLRSIIGGQSQPGVDLSARGKLSLYLHSLRQKMALILNPAERAEFTRNMLMPLLLSVGLIGANKIYLGLPNLLIIPAVIFMTYVAYFAYITKKRHKEFNLNFKEALTTITGAVSAGRTFLQAMSDYAFQSDSKLGKEFDIIVRKLNVGEEADQVFLDSWKRYPYKEYYFFSVVILLNIRGGGRLKEVLDKLQKSIATGLAIEKRMLAMTSEMRMAVKITGAIPFVFLLMIRFISPENFDFVMNDEKGKFILYYLLGSELVGLLIIKFLMRRI